MTTCTEDSRTDQELMVAYAGGDAGAFRALFERYAALLARVMHSHLRRREDVDDLVQQTFLQVHRARREFRADGPFRAWLFTIALNVRREHFRHRARHPEAPLEVEVEAGLEAAPPQEGALRDGEVATALGGLAATQREVIRLHWYEGFSFPEIAALVGASVSAVKVRAHRGYQALRSRLGEDHAVTDRSQAASTRAGE